MADKITVRNTESKYKSHPSGQFVAKCVDVIDLGQKVVDWTGTPKYLAPKCALVFRTGEKNDETGDIIDVSVEYTISMGEKSNMRPFLEGWRGKDYTADEAEAGVPLDKLEGKWALIQVGSKVSAKQRTYAIIMTAMGAPKSMALPDLPAYTRADYWADRKQEYKLAADIFRAEIGVDDRGKPLGDDEDGDPGPTYDGDEHDDLPF